MITKKQNIAIIGAGISGLSLANMLKDIANVKVLRNQEVLEEELPRATVRILNLIMALNSLLLKLISFKNSCNL